MLKSAGLQESDVTLVTVDRNAMANAVVKREADAISMWEPEAQAALEGLGGDASVFENIALYREWFSLYTTTDVLNDVKQREALVEFVRALLAAADNVRSRPQEAIPIVARAINQTEAVVKGAWPHHAFPAALPKEMLDVLTEEEGWVAAIAEASATYARQRSPRSSTRRCSETPAGRSFNSTPQRPRNPPGLRLRGPRSVVDRSSSRAIRATGLLTGASTIASAARS